MNDKINFEINSIVEDMYRFIDEHPDLDKPSEPNRDAVMVFNPKSGCYSTPDKIIHSDECTCGFDYDEFAQDEANW